MSERTDVLNLVCQRRSSMDIEDWGAFASVMLGSLIALDPEAVRVALSRADNVIPHGAC